MSNLTAQKRMDRNGKLVTRHVKTDNGSASSVNIPRVGSDPVTDKRIASKAAALLDSIKDSEAVKDMGFWKRRKFMKTLAPDTMLTLAGPETRGSIPVVPSKLIHHCVNKGSFAPLNDLAAYLADYGPLPDGSAFEPAYYLAPLQHSDINDPASPSPYGFVPYGQASAEERDVQNRIIRAIEDLKGASVEFSRSMNNFDLLPSRRFKSDTMVRYMKDHPEEIEDITDIIAKRNITAETDEKFLSILELMNTKDTTANALDEGVL